MIAHRLALIFVSTTLLACSGPDDAGGGDSGGGPTITSASSSTTSTPCVPGAQSSCACLGGPDGVQICRPDGSGYEPCQGCEASSGETSEAGTTGTTAATTTVTSTTAITSTTDITTSTTEPAAPCPGGPGELDLHQAILHDNPPNLADWPVTTSLTEIDFTNDGVHVLFSKIDGPDRWPDIIPPDWEGPLQYTLGMVECIDGQWHASAAIQYWYGLAASGGNVALDNQVANNWYYDAGRWGELAGRQPATGEIIGIFVVAGNARAVHEDDPLQSPVMERSNVVLVPMPDINGASHSY